MIFSDTRITFSCGRSHIDAYPIRCSSNESAPYAHRLIKRWDADARLHVFVDRITVVGSSRWHRPIRNTVKYQRIYARTVAGRPKMLLRLFQVDRCTHLQQPLAARMTRKLLAEGPLRERKFGWRGQQWRGGCIMESCHQIFTGYIAVL